MAWQNNREPTRVGNAASNVSTRHFHPHAGDIQAIFFIFRESGVPGVFELPAGQRGANGPGFSLLLPVSLIKAIITP